MNQDTQTESHVQPRGSHIDVRSRNLKWETMHLQDQRFTSLATERGGKVLTRINT